MADVARAVRWIRYNLMRLSYVANMISVSVKWAPITAGDIPIAIHKTLFNWNSQIGCVAAAFFSLSCAFVAHAHFRVRFSCCCCCRHTLSGRMADIPVAGVARVLSLGLCGCVLPLSHWVDMHFVHAAQRALHLTWSHLCFYIAWHMRQFIANECAQFQMSIFYLRSMASGGRRKDRRRSHDTRRAESLCGFCGM